MSNYITRSDVEGLGRIYEIPANFQEADIDTIIADTQKILEVLTKNKFESTTLTLVMNGTGCTSLFLYPYTTYPIISITSVKERQNLEDDWGDSTVETLASTDYYLPVADRFRIEINESWGSVRRFLIRPGYWWRGQANFQVIGQFGTLDADGNVPSSIKRALVFMVRDTLTPGYLKGRLVKREKWIDYEYDTGSARWENLKNKVTLTGYPEVDLLIRPFVIRVVNMRRA